MSRLFLISLIVFLSALTVGSAVLGKNVPNVALASCYTQYYSNQACNAFPYSRYVRALEVGNSITVRCVDGLNQHHIFGDGVVGRQFITGIDEAYLYYGNLPQTVIVELGTNGPVYQQNISAMMSALRGVKHVFFISVRVPRFWQNEVNATLTWARHYYRNVRIVQWYWYSNSHDDWFDPGGYHPTIGLGCYEFAHLINATLKANHV